MKVSFEGIGEMVATFYNNEATAGYPVLLSGNGEVSDCADGDAMLGVAMVGDGDYCGVMLKGCITLPYSGSAPALGWTALAANGAGGVKTADTGREYAVLAVDTAESTVCFIL